jgi:hypothetical protein
VSSEFELLVQEMAAEAQKARAPTMLKSITVTRRVPVTPAVPAAPQRSAAQIDAAARQTFKEGANRIMAKAMTAFDAKRLSGGDVNRIHARILLAADQMFK